VLNEALDTELASAPVGDVRIGLTFRDQSGRVCRSFTQAAASGLACREGDRWQLRGLFAAPEGQGGDYRMAAGDRTRTSRRRSIRPWPESRLTQRKKGEQGERLALALTSSRGP
jgi:hypothetical protein